MKAVILAGGLGTRMGSEAANVPKPMVRVGGFPIVWHIMKILHTQGIKEFIICAGHKGDIIRDYFLDYPSHKADLRIQYSSTGAQVELRPRSPIEDWVVNIVETGEITPTGGRILAISHLIGDEDFVITYGDGIADVDISAVLDAHQTSKAALTISTARPRNRFGVIEMSPAGEVTSFEEKPQGRELVNIGYMIASPTVFAYLRPDSVFESGPIRSLMNDGKLSALEHKGFWQPMDTPSELEGLNRVWASGSAPWASWI